MRLIVVAAAVVTIAVATVAHVVHGAAIPFFETFAEVVLGFVATNRRMLVHLVVIGVSVTAIHVIVAGRFHAFMEALALIVAVVIRIALPIAAILVLILRGAVLGVWGRRRLLCRSLDGYRSGHAKSKGGD